MQIIQDYRGSTMTDMGELLNSAFGKLAEKKYALFTSSELELNAKEQLKATEVEHILSGLITGKNAEQREAELFSMTEPEREACHNSRKAKAKDLLAYELAEMECDRLKWLIRLHKGVVADD
jgi:hypothetical protein